MQNKFFISALLLGLTTCPSMAAVYDLDVAINKVRENCSGLESKMDHLKLMAGINTGIGAVGTVTGGVALGTGIAKAQKDSEIESSIDKWLNKIDKKTEATKDKKQMDKEKADFAKKREEFNKTLHEKMEKTPDWSKVDDKNEFIEKEDDKNKAVTGKEAKELLAKEKESKTLGNVRTGMLAASTATNIAGAVISSQNKTSGTVKEKIDKCLAATDDLRDSMMQARIENKDTTKAKRIVDACSEYKYADLSKIDKMATGSTITSSVGAVAGGIGTVTSAMANTDATRKDYSAAGESKEKGLNTASNVLSGVTTASSAVSTVLNGVQIATIKKVVSTAQNCEKELQ